MSSEQSEREINVLNELTERDTNWNLIFLPAWNRPTDWRWMSFCYRTKSGRLKLFPALSVLGNSICLSNYPKVGDIYRFIIRMEAPWRRIHYIRASERDNWIRKENFCHPPANYDRNEPQPVIRFLGRRFDFVVCRKENFFHVCRILMFFHTLAPPSAISTLLSLDEFLSRRWCYINIKLILSSPPPSGYQRVWLRKSS